MPEWPNGLDLRSSSIFAYGGSNPPPHISYNFTLVKLYSILNDDSNARDLRGFAENCEATFSQEIFDFRVRGCLPTEDESSSPHLEF